MSAEGIMRTCPRCQEWCAPDGLWCPECGTRLVLSKRELETIASGAYSRAMPLRVTSEDSPPARERGR